MSELAKYTNQTMYLNIKYRVDQIIPFQVQSTEYLYREIAALISLLPSMVVKNKNLALLVTQKKVKSYLHTSLLGQKTYGWDVVCVNTLNGMNKF